MCFRHAIEIRLKVIGCQRFVNYTDLFRTAGMINTKPSTLYPTRKEVIYSDLKL